MTDCEEVQWAVKLKESDRRRSTATVTALYHPLSSSPSFLDSRNEVVAVHESDVKPEFFDPLGALSDVNITDVEVKHVDIDILCRPEHDKSEKALLTNTLETQPADKVIIDIILPGFTSWRTKRLEILNKCAVGEDLTISSRFLRNSSSNNKYSINDKKKKRLEVLEDLSGLQKISQLSQIEFMRHVDELRELLVVAWENNKRNEAIMLITDLARMMSSLTNLTFYPKQWVLITDILDLFASLVYNRLLTKANEERASKHLPHLPSTFTSNDVPDKAMEIAKNWFCKIADIKELIPRFYVETALISCLRFLDSQSFSANLVRLCSMTSLFPSALLSVYGRAYICKISMNLNPNDRTIPWKALNDTLQSDSFNEISNTWPAIDWIVQCVAYKALSVSDLQPVFEYSKQVNKRFIVSSFIKGVSDRYIGEHISEFTGLVLSEPLKPSDVALLGERCADANIDESSEKLIIKKIWKYIVGISDVMDYMICCESWMKYTSRHVSIDELSYLLGDIVGQCEQCDKLIYSRSLANVISHLIEGFDDLKQLLREDIFHSLLDFLRDTEYSTACAKLLLSQLVKKNEKKTLNDFFLADFIIDEASILCSKFSPDTLDDEIVSSSKLICLAIDLVDSGTEAERYLEWLVNARGTLVDLPIVTEHVVRVLLVFSIQCVSNMKSGAKKATFLRACIANLFITIPSILSKQQQMYYSLQSLHICLLINSLPQAYAFVRYILSMLKVTSFNVSNESTLRELLSILVSVPDVCSSQPLLLYDETLEVMERKTTDSVVSIVIWCNCVRYMTAVWQPVIPGKFVTVQANDVLYGSSSVYREEVQKRISYLMNRIISIIPDISKKESATLLTVLDLIMDCFKIDVKISKLVLNLIKMYIRMDGSPDHIRYAIDSIVQQSATNPDLQSIADKLSRI